MAVVTITEADVSFSESGSENSERHTRPAAEAINAGQYVRLDTDGKIALGNSSSATEVGVIRGIAINSGEAGETITMLSRGILDVGDDLAALDILDPVYVNNTDGTVGDAAGTTSSVIAYVVGVFTDTTARKVLFVDRAY